MVVVEVRDLTEETSSMLARLPLSGPACGKRAVDFTFLICFVAFPLMRILSAVQLNKFRRDCICFMGVILQENKSGRC